MFMGFTDAEVKHMDISFKSHKTLTIMEYGSLFLY
ncbi:hypothetical protein J2746_002399 [Methanolobus bombayensis]|nr:hypothetical protein [Methanolobus bombayensis]